MRVIIATDYEDMCRKTANIIASQVIMKHNSVLGLATGSTPLGVYKRLAELYKSGDIDFSAVRAFNLDEYKGLDRDHEQSYAYYMRDNFFRHVNIPSENRHIPDGMAKDENEECERYNAELLSSGGIDLQLLGIGPNGHIGFNEPSDIIENETHCITLSESTINANSRFFERYEDVPRQAYTMGIGSIMSAAKVILIASGKEKAEIMKRTISGPITSHVPASLLRLHRDFTVILDRDAYLI